MDTSKASTICDCRDWVPPVDWRWFRSPLRHTARCRSILSVWDLALEGAVMKHYGDCLECLPEMNAATSGCVMRYKKVDIILYRWPFPRGLSMYENAFWYRYNSSKTIWNHRVAFLRTQGLVCYSTMAQTLDFMTISDRVISSNPAHNFSPMIPGPWLEIIG